MPQLSNNRHELFAQYCLIYNKSESYLKAGYDCKKKYAAQNAYNLCKKNPEVSERITELETIARSDAKNEVNDYIKLFDDIAFCRNDFAGENKPKTEVRMTAATKAMKAQGIEGDTKLKIDNTGTYYLTMHSAPKEKEEEDGDSR